MITPAEPAPTSQVLGESLAAQIGEREWTVDEPVLDESIPSDVPSDDFSNTHDDVPMAKAVVEPEVPPAPLQIIEAMLFIGGQPLKPEKASTIIRGLTSEQFHEAIDMLNHVYRLQNRPYIVAVTDAGCSLAVRPRYRVIKEKIYGGPREARLTQPALDVLALVAYRQPAAKLEIDTIRGVESGHILRQLVRLGLIAVVQRAESTQREVCYGTTPRFLELFNLKNLEDLPQTGDPQRL